MDTSTSIIISGENRALNRFWYNRKYILVSLMISQAVRPDNDQAGGNTEHKATLDTFQEHIDDWPALHIKLKFICVCPYTSTQHLNT